MKASSKNKLKNWASFLIKFAKALNSSMPENPTTKNKAKF